MHTTLPGVEEAVTEEVVVVEVEVVVEVVVDPVVDVDVAEGGLRGSSALIAL